MRKTTLVQFQQEPLSTPLGALYLAYGLEKENIDFDLKIYPIYRYGLEVDALYSLLARSGDIIAIGCWSDYLPYVIVALERIKKRFPAKTVILGGIGPTEVAEEILARFQSIDFIIKGCGVYLLPRLIKRIRKGNRKFGDIDGLVYRHQNKIISNRYGGFCLNIPDLPAYHRIGNIRQYREFDIFTSFGCPYRCTYCYAAAALPKKITYRDPAEVVEEIRQIKALKGHKKFLLHIRDEAFMINRKRVFEYCRIFRSQHLGISWTCYGRVDAAEAELLRNMSKSGCREIYYGVESGSDRTLGRIKKGFTIEEAVNALLLSKKYIKTVIASFICLYPFEKIKDFIETKFYLHYLQTQGIWTQLYPLVPVKNSEMYSEFKERLTLPKNMDSPHGRTFDSMPEECKKIIKNNPGIFPHYYSYKVQELNKILQLAAEDLAPQSASQGC